uniref:Conserved secreted protein n=1 Tax=Haemonchus contortus TaxID=6289 RepID=A0A7I4XYB3_HAECO
MTPPFSWIVIPLLVLCSVVFSANAINPRGSYSYLKPGAHLNGERQVRKGRKHHVPIYRDQVDGEWTNGSDHRLLRANIRFSHKLEKIYQHRAKSSKHVVYVGGVLNDVLFRYDWQVLDDPTEDYDALVRVSSLVLSRQSLHEWIPPLASHLERLQVNISRRQAVRRDLQLYMERRLLEAALNRTSLRKCYRDLQDHRNTVVLEIPMAFSLSCFKEDGTLTTSRFEMEEVTRRFYTNPHRSTTHVRKPKIPTGGTAPRILSLEVRVAIASMKTGTTPSPDKISAKLLLQMSRNFMRFSQHI